MCSFNQLLNNWDISNVIRMCCMFSHTICFNQSLNNWNISHTQYSGYIYYKLYLN